MGGLKVDKANFTRLILNRGQILASTLRNRSDEYKTELIRQFIDSGVMEDFKTKKLRPIIDQVTVLSKAQQAHEAIENN